MNLELVSPEFESGQLSAGDNGNGHPRAVDELDEMKERITRSESLVRQAGALISIESQRFEEIRQGLRTAMDALKAGLAEKEGVIQRKNSVIQELEENLNAKIGESANLAEEKESLTSRVSELKNLIGEKEGNLEVANRRIDELEACRRDTEVKMISLEAQMKEREDEVQRKEFALEDLERGLFTKINDLDNQLREKEGLLEAAVGEVRRLQEGKQVLEVRVALMEGELIGRDEMLRKKEQAVKELEESLTQKIRELENRVNVFFREMEGNAGEQVAL